MEQRFVAPGVMTGVGRHTEAVAALPGDFAGVARVVQGVLIHEFWGDAYGVEFADGERETVHLRPADEILDAVVARDGRALDIPRAPGGRNATNCRGFSTVGVAMLRAHGVPARARCGFGTYFRQGWFEDHWVVEFHDGERWRLADPQIDDVQRKALGIDFDLSDVGERFVVAGEAWRRVRAGEADAAKFGLSQIGEGGEYWIAANLMRDAASLDGLELLPWDVWGVMPEPDDTIDAALFDELAAATIAVDLDAVRRLMADPRLRVPDKVTNILRGRPESIVR